MDFIFKCPWCGHEYDGLDFVEPTDMDGEFITDCKECKRQFEVKFKTTISFETEKANNS